MANTTVKNLRTQRVPEPTSTLGLLALGIIIGASSAIRYGAGEKRGMVGRSSNEKSQSLR